MHNHIKKIEQLRTLGIPPADGKLRDCQISHDDWCNIYRGGECNYDPDIEYREITKANAVQVFSKISGQVENFAREIEKKKL
jgi:hypothetical protein